MDTLKALRAANQRTIQENPVDVTIHRVLFLPDGAGGRQKQEEDIPPFQGRIMPSKQQLKKRQDEAGEMQISAWTLIAPWDADIKAGSNVIDTFQVNGRSFRVVRVIPRKFIGKAYSIQAVLDEVM